MAEEFQNPKHVFKREAERQKLRDSFPDRHPKINTTFDSIPYAHNEPAVGNSLGMTEDEAITMADKFAKAEKQARSEGDRGLVSRTMAILMPTLTPKEMVFAVSHLLCHKLEHGM